MYEVWLEGRIVYISNNYMRAFNFMYMITGTKIIYNSEINI